ncbi:MAG: hypothetical protein AABX82_05830 [Nanoarchaeota archaeon]
MGTTDIGALVLTGRLNVRKVDEIYNKMRPAQRAYFSQQNVGPHAQYTDTSGVWPDKAAMKNDILETWGRDSQAMRYFREVFKVPYD